MEMNYQAYDSFLKDSTELHKTETCFAQLVVIENDPKTKKLGQVELGVQNYVLKSVFNAYTNHLFVPTGPKGIIIGGSFPAGEP